MANLSGNVLVQRFRLDFLQRQDELGDQYRGWDLKRNLPLTVIVLRAELEHDPALLSFHQGQMTMQTMAHPHIVPFYGLYQDRNLSFMVEKFAEGTSLADILAQRRGQPTPVEEALIYLKALSSAAGYVHSFGLIHCNIKPAYVVLEKSGNILLAGFGLARSADSPMTASGIAGVPAYMAPEAIRGETVTPATDLYSLGVVLYELVAGRHPFLNPGESLQSPGVSEYLVNAHLSQSPSDPRLVNPAIPAGLAQLIVTTLAKSPRDRYQSSQEMLEVACAVLSKSPQQIPDRLSTPGAATAAGADLLVAPAGGAPRPVQPGAAPLPSATYAAYQPPQGPNAPRPGAAQPAYVPPTQAAQPGYVPPTQVVQPGYVPPTQVAPQPSYATYPLPQPTQAAPSQRLAPPKRAIPWVPIAIAGFVLFLCAGLAVAGGLFFLNGFTALTPTPTSTLVATLTATSPPADTQPAPPTEPAGLMITDTPTPTNTPLPTDTPRPTPTRLPTNTPMPSSFTVTIRNNLGYPILAHRDGSLMGTDPIPPGMYIYYKGIPPGPHNFTFCRYDQPSKCPYNRTVNIDSDLTIAVP